MPNTGQVRQVCGFERSKHDAGYERPPEPCPGDAFGPAAAPKPGSDGSCGERTPSTLKRAPIPLRRQEPRDTAFDFAGTFRVCGHQSRGSLDDAERAEKLRLHDGAIERQPGAVQCRGKIVKIDVDRQVRFARRGQRQLVSVAANRLQRVARRRGRVTVVDHQQCNRAAPRQLLKCLGELVEPLRFDDGAGRRIRKKCFERLSRTIAVDGSRIAGCRRRRARRLLMCQPSAVLIHWATGQESRNSLAKMIAGGVNASSSRRQLSIAGEIGQRCILQFGQSVAGFDEMDAGDAGEARHDAGCAECVAHHRSASGSVFDERDGIGRAGTRPAKRHRPKHR